MSVGHKGKQRTLHWQKVTDEYNKQLTGDMSQKKTNTSLAVVKEVNEVKEVNKEHLNVSVLQI